MNELLKSIGNAFGAVPQAQASIAQIQTDAQQGVDQLKVAIKTQLVLQAISTGAVLFLCYLAWEESQKKRRA